MMQELQEKGYVAGDWDLDPHAIHDERVVFVKGLVAGRMRVIRTAIKNEPISPDRLMAIRHGLEDHIKTVSTHEGLDLSGIEVVLVYDYVRGSLLIRVLAIPDARMYRQWVGKIPNTWVA